MTLTLLHTHYSIFLVLLLNHIRIYIMQINVAKLPMEVDTGASITLVSKSTYDGLWEAQVAPPIQSTNSELRTYAGENIEVLGILRLLYHFRNKNMACSY